MCGNRNRANLLFFNPSTLNIIGQNRKHVKLGGIQCKKYHINSQEKCVIYEGDVPGVRERI